MKPTHKKIFRHVCDNLDEHLDSEACREIRRHLEGCPDCLRYLESLMATVTLYRRYPEPRLSPRAKKQLRSMAR